MNATLEPLICGQWDAMHLWAQWNDVGGPYLFEWRHLLSVPDSTHSEQWSAWQSVERTGGLNRHWLVLPMWRAGATVQARVAVKPATGVDVHACIRAGAPGAVSTFAPLTVEDPQWELAQEVTFSKSRCRFRIEANEQARPLHLPKGAELHGHVDGAPAIYVLTESVEILPRTQAEFDAESIGLSGYHQLDNPGDFRTTPRLGLVITNLTPSENDTVKTGGDRTKLEALKKQPPLRLSYRGENRL